MPKGSPNGTEIDACAHLESMQKMIIKKGVKIMKKQWPKSIKSAARGPPPLGGGGEIKTVAGGKGTKKHYIFDAHRVDFERGPKREQFRTKTIQSMKKLWPGTFPEKTSKLDRFPMPLQEARKGRKNAFAWYLLRFKRFSRGHEIRWKIDGQIS